MSKKLEKIELVLNDIDPSDIDHLYTEEFWKGVEVRVDIQQDKFAKENAKMGISHEQLHKPFDI